MKKTKRNKKYNPLKILSSAAQVSLRNTGILYLVSNGKAELVNIKNGSLAHCTARTLEYLTKVRRKWSIYLLVFRKRQDGQKYIDIGEAPIDVECFSSQLNSTINTAAEAWAMKNGNPLHNVNMGWLAIPAKVELSKDTIYTMCTPWEPWDYLAQWEAKEKGWH